MYCLPYFARLHSHFVCTQHPHRLFRSSIANHGPHCRPEARLGIQCVQVHQLQSNSVVVILREHGSKVGLRRHTSNTSWQHTGTHTYMDVGSHTRARSNMHTHTQRHPAGAQVHGCEITHPHTRTYTYTQHQLVTSRRSHALTAAGWEPWDRETTGAVLAQLPYLHCRRLLLMTPRKWDPHVHAST